MVTLVKYRNRKLYSTALSRYTTLDEVRDMVKNHVKFQVIDSVTKVDITAKTLAMAVATNPKLSQEKLTDYLSKV